MATRESGITYEQVAATADALVAQGDKATVRAIRALTSGGSPNTILRHLQTWRSRQQVAPNPAMREMPPAMVRAYQEELTRAAAEARAAVEAQLVDAQMETADLARGSDELERERDQLLEQLEHTTRERDEIAGKEAVLSVEVQGLREELERERRAAEEARILVAQERHEGEASRRMVETAAAEMKRLRGELHDERDARVEAQREQARLLAENHAAATRLADMQEGLQHALHNAGELRARADQLLALERSSALEVARLAGKLEGRGKYAEDWDQPGE